MNDTRILITGAAGFLGWNIARYFHHRDAVVVGVWNRAAVDPSVVSRRIQLDITDRDAASVIAGEQPDLIVHCAAMSARSDCEADPLRAHAVNVEASQKLAESARAVGARFVFISTDLVFDGDSAPYREGDVPSPISLYGETKVKAEAAVMAANPESHILRTALMYGNGPGSVPGSFLTWTLNALRCDETLRLYTNQYRTALFAPDVPRLIELLRSQNAPGGIYHAAGPDCLSRYDTGLRIAEAYGYSADCIAAAEVPRPDGLGPTDDCSLVIDKSASLGMHFTSLADGLAQLTR